ncbi:hypothetical protein Ancab_038741 [Ancistrocladus abbreviatus]
MSKLLHSPHLQTIHRRSLSSFILSKHLSLLPLHLSSPLSFCYALSSSSSFVHFTLSPCYSLSTAPKLGFRNLSVRAFDDSSSPETEAQQNPKSDSEENQQNGAPIRRMEEYPTGEFEFKELGAWEKFLVKLRMLFAFPWERVRKGSILTMKLRGQISDQLRTRFSSGLSLPQICENLIKAAYDPRISGIYLHIEPLSCGWGKIDEIHRHIVDFRKSGKFIMAYIPACGEKEYYLASACEELYAPPSAYFRLYGLTVQGSFLGGVFEKVGVEPQVERIGKYKSAGDLLTRKSISEENREMLTALLDNIYGNWLDKISSTKEKKREDIENFINQGFYQVESLKEEALITDIKYDDEVLSMLKEKLGLPKDKNLSMVDYRRYSRVRKWTLGLTGGKDKIAVIRASGSISRVRSPLSSPMSGIIAEQLIEKIRSVRESKRYKAAIIRIDSPGGDALASDFMFELFGGINHESNETKIAQLRRALQEVEIWRSLSAGEVLEEFQLCE